MPGNLQPLDQKFAIVDAQGNPTDYFTRWAQQRQIDIVDSITLADLQAYLTAHMLREGSGIQFTPDGDINNSPLIAADVQEILDQVSATRGVVLYRGLLGWAALAPGTAGFVLSTNGAGADPTWIAPPAGGGALVLLEQHAAAASASLNFTTAISATYDEYLIEFVNVIPATNAVKLYMRMSTNGGASYDAGANYSWHAWGANRFTGGGSAGLDSGATQIQMQNSAGDNTSTAGIIGSARLFSPGSTALHKAVRGTLGFLTSGTVESAEFTGSYRSLTAVNAFQFLFSAGNITSGIIRVYGVAK